MFLLRRDSCRSYRESMIGLLEEAKDFRMYLYERRSQRSLRGGGYTGFREDDVRRS